MAHLEDNRISEDSSISVETDSAPQAEGKKSTYEEKMSMFKKEFSICPSGNNSDSWEIENSL